MEIDRIDGGVNTARLSAAEQDRVYREQRQADALAFLTKRGLDDVAEILGLVTPATPSPKARRRIGDGRPALRPLAEPPAPDPDYLSDPAERIDAVADVAPEYVRIGGEQK